MLDLIDEFWNKKIQPKNWESFVSHVIYHKGRRKFRKTDHIVDNEMEPAIIKYCSSSESDSDSDMEQY